MNFAFVTLSARNRPAVEGLTARKPFDCAQGDKKKDAQGDKKRTLRVTKVIISD
jgi:hypothetical protein